MRDRIEQAKKRIQRDQDRIRRQFSDVLEEKGKLMRDLKSLNDRYEQEKSECDARLYELDIEAKRLNEEDIKLKAQFEALDGLEI